MEEDTISAPSKENVYDKANFISKLFFYWATAPLWKSYKGVDVIDNSANVPRVLSAQRLGDLFIEKCDVESKIQKKSLLLILCQIFIVRCIFASTMLFFRFCILNLVQVILMRMLLTTFTSPLNGEEDNQFVFHRYVTAIILCLSLLLSNFSFTHAFMLSEIFGAQLRVTLSNVVFQKLLKISTAEMKRVNIGQLLNIFSSDVGKLDDNMKWLGMRLFDIPITVFFVVYLQLAVGYPAVIGFVVVFLLGISSLYFGKMFKNFGDEKAGLVDRRLSLTRELISEARTMKLLCWEDIYCQTIDSIRNKELKLCFQISVLKSIYFAIGQVSASIGMLITLSIMLASNYIISSPNIYPCVTIINATQSLVIRVLARTIESSVYAYVSLQRIQKILMINEMEGMANCQSDQPPAFDHVTCGWSSPFVTQEGFLLHDVNVVFPKYEMITITGPVGSGKSTLLLTLANEMYVHKGRVATGGSITYMPQEPWLFPASIKQNILFGLPYDQHRYQNILFSCALIQDLSILPKADATNMDDKGLTLSGGQKARIALARALYRQSEVYLLDDPLSAIDIRVGRHIWQNCFASSKATIILVSHCLHFLCGSNFVFNMEKDKISFGEYAELKDTLELSEAKDTVDEVAEDKPIEETLDNGEKTQLANVESKENDASSNLLTFCRMAYGGLNGWVVIFLVVGLSLLAQSFNIVYNIFFISFVYWRGSQASSNYTIGWNVPLPYLAYMIAVESVLHVFQAIVFFYFCIRASKRLHHKVLQAVIHTKMFFFDTHFTGTIINRFSKDMDIIDDILPMFIFDTIMIFCMLLSILVTACYSNVIAIAPIILCLIIAGIITQMYQKALKLLKPKEANARAPIYTYMNCSLPGVSVIRSHEMSSRVTDEFKLKLDNHSRIWFCLKSLGFWLSFTCECVGNIICILVIIITVLLPNYSNSSRLGMAISTTFMLGSLLQYCIRMYAEVDHLFFAVAHLSKYLGISAEAGCEISPDKQSATWPASGTILFKDVNLIYGNLDKPALNNLNFQINSGEKIGIVGRTGAGKTSLVAAFFRLADITGAIYIDGVDIATLPLSNYRKKLSVIPQNPTILSGPLRRNLDPWDEFSDEQLWEVLECVQLKEFVMRMEKGLQQHLTDMSAGEKQLFCLARTLLKQNKIIILDEATSNVDNRTDKIIQQLIRTKFSSSTVLVIAHRLQTVMDMDRIIVMQQGEIVEMDTVPSLLKLPDGVFRSMMEKANLV